jgi:hypothetical protein
MFSTAFANNELSFIPQNASLYTRADLHHYRFALDVAVAFARLVVIPKGICGCQSRSRCPPFCCHSVAQRRNLLLPLFLPLPALLLSFRSAAEESAVALVLAVALPSPRSHHP